MSTPREHHSDGNAALYTFDCRGYLIHPRFLNPMHLADARQHFSQLEFISDAWHEGQQRSANIHLSSGFLGTLGKELYRHPTTSLTIGYPHHLLESYALRRERGQLDLHGGAAEFVCGSDAVDISARSWTHSGRSYALRVKVLIYLDDVTEPEEGRLAYIEGSHKADFAFHRAFPEGRRVAKDLVRTVEVRAGDAIWLNEALLHGAERKTSSTQRRLLAYTFGPTFMASWSENEEHASTTSGYARAETEQAG
ncbi:MAG: phytanoyl-CoA dioxygenase family protein [Rhizobiales bacterium]|nr:phytanoyl-CoA dioxygenase family protein [Hyphomicrobiales bacterium]